MSNPSGSGGGCLQTPHTLRLLKLIHEGTPKFASLAVERLPTNASADVLWDLLGRLQAILTSTEWKTRHAAARAMEKLGEQLDPEDFLKQQGGHNELSVRFVLDHLDTVVAQTPLYGSAQSKFDLADEDGIQDEDVSTRIIRQRELLARRLGLDSIGNVLGTDQTGSLPIADDDLVPRQPQKKRAKKPHAADDAILQETNNPFTALLVRQSQSGDDALNLLATELVYRMFHPSWWMRHGAILGLLALTKSFSRSFGAWTESVLARAMCLLALDRFGDFGGDTVAPVRETAAQLIAAIMRIAPCSIKNLCIPALLKMASNTVSWEIRHGALSTMKFLVALARTDDCVVSMEQMGNITDAAIQGLSDPSSDDVVSAAAKVLIEYKPIAWDAAAPMWTALTSIAPCASSVVDLVALLQRMAAADPARLESIIGQEPTDLIVGFMASPFPSVRTSALEVIGVIGTGARAYETAFELFYRDEISEELVRTSWAKLASRCTSVPIWRLLLDRYFSIGTTRDKGAGLPVKPASALAVLYKPSFSAITDFYLTVMAQSPWIDQCESALQLYSYIQDLELPVLDEVMSDETNLLCTRAATEGDLESLIPLRDHVVRDSVDRILLDGGVLVEGKKDILVKWKSLTKGLVAQPNILESMRVRAGVAGAQISKGRLPSAVTPMIRALVTSFNSEEDHMRRLCTSRSLCKFIELSRQRQLNGKAEVKILNMVCDLAGSRLVDSGRMLRRQRDSATYILQSMVSVNSSIDRWTGLWERLNPLLRKATNDEKLSAAILAQAIAKGLNPDSPSLHCFVDTFVGPLVDAVVAPTIASIASDTIGVLGRLLPTNVLDVAVPRIALALKDDRLDRSVYCELLGAIADSCEASIGPFIRTLLPSVMALLTNRECSKVANSLFASLVRCAPLVERDTKLEEISVIDHLIFGEPLPACPFPPKISESLRLANIVLRNYQLEGVSWLQFLRKVNVSGALCDGTSRLHSLDFELTDQVLDMGLGKTLQALLGIALAHEEGGPGQKSIVICPATLVRHWEVEVYKYFPCRKVFQVLALLGSAEERSSSLKNSLSSSNLIVLSYAVLRSDIGQIREAHPAKWCYCVLDEGHLLKNPETVTAKAARKLQAKHKLILSGTPIQNKVQELWAVFDFLMPCFLGDSKSFEKNFAKPVGKGRSEGASAAAIAEGLEALKLLHQTVLPFILRREKSQVLPELPAMTETVVKVSMSKIQRQIYASFCRGNHASTVLEKLRTEGLEGKALPSDLFKSLLFLRLVCTHPSMVFPSDVASTRQDLCHISSSGKLLALAELLREAGIIDSGVYGADNDCSVLYCADDEIRENDDGFNSLISPVSDAAEAAAPIFNKKSSETKVSKCLIFAQFSKSLDKVEELLLGSSAMQGRYLRLCGKTPPAERIGKCTLFQEDNNIRLMILTARIGGLGLNLQAADRVIFLENDYNPQVDMQAIDRTRRIGQDRVVNVYKLITQDSVEEVILRMQREKLKLAKAVVSTENSSIFSMGTERLLDIFAGRAAEPKKQGEDDTIDLDGMLESCMEDYKTLTASFFEQNII